MSAIRSSVNDRVATLVIENPPVNAMSIGVPGALIEKLEAADADPEVDAIVIAGGGNGSIAGADIKQQGKPWPEGEPKLTDLIAALDGVGKPLVAALQGHTLGGGFEIAMACHYRVIDEGGVIGQPEVKLGIPPGAGGTQRLPRLVGAEAALDMIVTGKPIKAANALEIGAVDLVVADDVLGKAQAFARSKAGTAIDRVRDREVAPVASGLFDQWRAKLDRKPGGNSAALACVDLIELSTAAGFDEGIARERATFSECVASSEAASLRHVFRAERDARKVPGVSEDATARAIASAAVIGAGKMGVGIAICFADAAIPVALIDKSEEVLERAAAMLDKHYARLVEKGRLDRGEAERRRSLVTTESDLGAAAKVDLVIEAVFEDMDLKKTIFAQLDAICGPDAVLATNTSYLDVNELARSVPQRAQNILGLHFFNPANVMRLLEVVRGDATGDAVVLTGMELGRKLGKLPILSGVCHGFIGNRMFSAYRREADFLVEEGASIEQVDRVIREFGFPMGPFEVADLAGLGVGWAKRKATAHLRNPDERYSTLADMLCEDGRLGRLEGKGYYRYEDGRTPLVDPDLDAFIEKSAAHSEIERRQVSDQEIVERCIYALVNEGAEILGEGVAQRASDIDLVWLNGYGFPAWRGGPMFYAQTVGFAEVLETVRRFDAQHDFWTPSETLIGLAGEAAELEAVR